MQAFPNAGTRDGYTGANRTLPVFATSLLQSRLVTDPMESSSRSPYEKPGRRRYSSSAEANCKSES
jgi:hypothetical protein